MTKKKPNWFLRILSILFFIYVTFYVADITGYYEKTVRKQAIMTEEARAQFEKDLANNKSVDIKDYLPKEIDYSNFFTKSANETEMALCSFFENDLKGVWDVLRALFIG